jgi:hypothetical protein
LVLLLFNKSILHLLVTVFVLQVISKVLYQGSKIAMKFLVEWFARFDL